MAKKKLITTHELTGIRVTDGKRGTRRVGKIRYFVFHPREKRVVGFIVKRPDFLWMFKRKDRFVSIDGYDMIDGHFVVRLNKEATDNAAYRDLGLNPEECLLWIGLPLMTEDGESFGVVGNVIFNQITGTVESVESSTGMTSSALLGKLDIPAEMIFGFKKGKGVALSNSEGLPPGQDGQEVEQVLGCILVSDEVREFQTEGGLAEKAGAATAVAFDKAGKATASVTEKVSEVAGDAAKKTGEVVNKGAYVTGKQIGKTKTMFADFKDEFDKASHTDEDEDGTELMADDAADEGEESVASGTKKATSKTTTTKKKKSQSSSSAGTKGADVVGEQLKKTKGMFSSFKEEYDKARGDK